MLAKTVVVLDVSISCKSGGAWNLLVVVQSLVILLAPNIKQFPVYLD